MEFFEVLLATTLLPYIVRALKYGNHIQGCHIIKSQIVRVPSIRAIKGPDLLHSAFLAFLRKVTAVYGLCNRKFHIEKLSSKSLKRGNGKRELTSVLHRDNSSYRTYRLKPANPQKLSPLIKRNEEKKCRE